MSASAMPTERPPRATTFICGLERATQTGRFYTASSKFGLLRIAAERRSLRGPWPPASEIPTALGLGRDGTITVPNSEGEWTPASMICEIRPGGHYGYQGPKGGPKFPMFPLVYLPRGPSTTRGGGQVTVPRSAIWSARRPISCISALGWARTSSSFVRSWTASPRGAVVPLPGEFRSGVHRGDASIPATVSSMSRGMTGWGTYTPDDGCFQRVRYTRRGKSSFRLRGTYTKTASSSLSRCRSIRASPKSVDRHFAQAWN